MKLHQRFVAFLIPLLATCFMSATPTLANAQPKKSRYAPQISSFQFNASDQFTPGSDLDFTVEGTPRGQASVRLSGVNKNIVLRETEEGIYEGSYTLSRRDKLGTTPTARATLRVRGVAVAVDRVMVNASPPLAVTPPALLRHQYKLLLNALL